MEVVNHYKISSIISTYIGDKYKELFKQRFKEESGGTIEWKSNVAHGKLLIDQFLNSHSSNKLLINETEKQSISSGELDKFSYQTLSKLLLHSKYHRINAAKIERENQIISKIEAIHNCNRRSNYNIVENYNAVKSKLIEYSKELFGSFSGNRNSNKNNSNNSSNNNNSNNNNSGNNIIEEEISYLIDTLQLDSNKNINDSNRESEANANKLRQLGNDHFAKESYSEAVRYYTLAKNLPNLSNYTKSILNMNSTITGKNISTEMTEKAFLGDTIYLLVSALSHHENYEVILISISEAIGTFLFRPSWYKPYYIQGILHSKLSKYPKAITYWQAALLLDSSEENKKVIGSLISQATSKLSIITKSLLPSGLRDYEKESKYMLYSTNHFNYLQLIKDNFKDTLDQKSLKSLVSSKPPLLENMNQLIDIGLPENKALEYIFACGKNIQFQNSYMHKAIGSGTDLAKPYFKYALSSNDKKNQKAMLVKTSTLPTPFHQTNHKASHQQTLDLFNYQVAISCEFLGIIYLHGLFGEDIDFAKAGHYFYKSIRIDEMLKPEDLKSLGCSGYSYLALGQMFFKNRLSHTKSKEYAIRIWSQGSKINDAHFQKDLLYQLNTTSQESTSVLKSNTPILAKDTFKKDMLNFSRVIKIEPMELLSAPNLIQAKQAIEKKNSPYSIIVFEIYTVISKFIQSFNSVSSSLSSLSIDQRIELIKPLADLYCMLDMGDIIRFPPSISYMLEEFISNLLTDAAKNPIVTLTYICFNNSINKVLEHDFETIVILNNSIPKSSLLSSSSSSSSALDQGQQKSQQFTSKYIQALLYFKCLLSFSDFNGNPLSQPLYDYSKFDNASFMFNYRLLTMFLYFKKAQFSFDYDQVLQLYHDALNHISTIPKDHPILIKYHISICGLLARLYSGNGKSHVNMDENNKQQILSHLEASLDLFKNLLDYMEGLKPSIKNFYQELLDIPELSNILPKFKFDQIKIMINQVTTRLF